MLITKVYETIFNLSPREMFMDIDQILIEKIKKRFENKCEGNSLIVKFLEIITRSNCRVSKSRLDGSGDIDVKFKAEAIVYNENDVLNNCEVQKIEKGTKIICKHERAVIVIDTKKILQSLKPGQKIPVKVGSVSYIKGNDKITIYGSPYTYSYMFNIYIANVNNIYQEDIDMLKIKIEQINDELEKHKKIDKKAYEFFDELLYPFINKIDYKKELTKNSKNKFLDCIELAKNIEKEQVSKRIFCRHTIIDKSTPDIIELDSEKQNNEFFDPEKFGIKIINENIIFILFSFLNDYLTHIRAIREMTEIYNTEKDLEQHNNIWNIYKSIKR